MVSEREVGRILEGIDNLGRRYSKQESRLDSLSSEVVSLTTSFAKQPSECFKSLEETFATKEQIKPLEKLCSTIERAAVYLLCSTTVAVLSIIIYYRDRL